VGNSKPILLTHADLTLLTSIIMLAQDLDAIVCKTHPEGFDNGLARAVASSVAPLRHVATGLRADDDPVKAGVMLRRSDGPVEGHINRVKMLNWSMWGCAMRDLQRRWFLGTEDVLGKLHWS
jgi:transposase